MQQANYHRSDWFFELILTLCLPYITFWTAENPLKLSGVLAGSIPHPSQLFHPPIAVVVMSIVVNHYAHFFIRHGHLLHQFWEVMSWTANTLVFMISGALVGESIYQREFHDAGSLSPFTFTPLDAHGKLQDSSL